MVIAGIVIVLATFIAIIKQFETRLVLLLSGLLMCFIGGQLSAGTTAFVKSLQIQVLYQLFVQCLVLVMLWSIQNVQSIWYISISAGLKKMTKIIIPGAVIITFLINIALPTAGRLCSGSRCSINSCTYSLRCASSDGRLCYFL